jgi:hypothetical protein
MIPSGAAVTMVKIGLPGEIEVFGADGLMHPTGTADDDGMAYVLLDNSAAGLAENGNIANLDNTSGLFKTAANSAGASWTHVMLRQNVPNELNELENNTLPPPHNYEDILLFGGDNQLNTDPDNAGVIMVDPGDPNVVYAGASTRYPGAPAFGKVPGPGAAFNDQMEKGHGLIRVDTTDMRDTNYLSPTIMPINNHEVYPNDGDDIVKRADATAFSASGLESGAEWPNGNNYTGEGVSWYDLNQNIDANSNDK